MEKERKYVGTSHRRSEIKVSRSWKNHYRKQDSCSITGWLVVLSAVLILFLLGIAMRQISQHENEVNLKLDNIMAMQQDIMNNQIIINENLRSITEDTAHLKSDMNRECNISNGDENNGRI